MKNYYDCEWKIGCELPDLPVFDYGDRVPQLPPIPNQARRDSIAGKKSSLATLGRTLSKIGVDFDTRRNRVAFY